MEYDRANRVIHTNKIINELDRATLEFVSILEKHIGYVIVSGYVSILLGRTRASEDVDFLVPPMIFQKFKLLFEDLAKEGYECANTSIAEEAFGMLDEHAIKFYKGLPVPHMEFKKITNSIQEEAFEKRLKVKLERAGKILFISPLELQIAYKLSIISKGNFEEISSDKDFEDAKHLYEYFLEKLNKEELIQYIKMFKAEEMWKWLQK